jgi:Peptidase A4 family
MRVRRRLMMVAVTGLASVATFASVGTASGAVPSGTSNGGGVFLPAPAPGGAHRGRNPALASGATVAYSTNWAGYIQSTSTQGTFTAVEDTWTVPTVSPTRKAEYSSDWVGIGGYNDSTLVQAGTEQDSIHHKAFYQAWTEVLPAPEDPLSLAISPGDRITVLVEETAADTWLMKVTDNTSGHSAQATASGNISSGASAEAVHERPCLANPCSKHLATLTKTTNVTFEPGDYSSSAAGPSPVFHPLLVAASGATLNESIMVKGKGRKIFATPSGTNSAGTGFSVADGGVAPPTPS